MDDNIKCNDSGSIEETSNYATAVNDSQSDQNSTPSASDPLQNDVAITAEAPAEGFQTATEPWSNDTQGSESAVAIEQIEDRSIFDLLYGVIVKPVDTFKYLSIKKPWVMAALLYVIISFISAIAGVPGQQDQLSEITKLSKDSGINIGAAAIIALIVVLPIFSFLGLFIVAGIYHLLAKLFKGTGSYKGLISTLGFAGFPSIISTPFSLLYFIGGPVGKIVAMATTLSVSFALGIWVLILNILAIRENYKLSTAKAVAVCLIPVAVVVILVIVLLTMLIVFAATQMPGGDFS